MDRNQYAQPHYRRKSTLGEKIEAATNQGRACAAVLIVRQYRYGGERDSVDVAILKPQR